MKSDSHQIIILLHNYVIFQNFIIERQANSALITLRNLLSLRNFLIFAENMIRLYSRKLSHILIEMSAKTLFKRWLSELNESIELPSLLTNSGINWYHSYNLPLLPIVKTLQYVKTQTILNQHVLHLVRPNSSIDLYPRTQSPVVISLYSQLWNST